MPAEEPRDPVLCLEDALLSLDLPNVEVVDLGWGPIARHFGISEEFRVLVERTGISYRRPVRRACADIGDAVATARSYLASRGSECRQVFLLARVNGDWKERRDRLKQLFVDNAAVSLLVLTPAGSKDSMLAICEVADHILGRGEALQDSTQGSGRNLELGRRVRDVAGVELPVVLVVGGNAEKQGRAADQIGVRAMEEFGIEARWIFTDYNRPARVVEDLKREYDSVTGSDGTTRLVGAVFSQLFNATDAKRDGMEFLRSKRVLVIAPQFKSLGSALHAIEVVLGQYCSPHVEDEASTRTD